MKKKVSMKAVKIVAKVLGAGFLGVAAVLGAAETDESTQKVIKKIAPKFVDKMGES